LYLRNDCSQQRLYSVKHSRSCDLLSDCIFVMIAHNTLSQRESMLS
jgi:hypothetical protein